MKTWILKTFVTLLACVIILYQVQDVVLENSFSDQIKHEQSKPISRQVFSYVSSANSLTNASSSEKLHHGKKVNLVSFLENDWFPLFF